MKNKVILLLLICSIFSNINMVKADDLDIQKVLDRNIVTPYSDGDYKLNKHVTRAEYLTALYKTVCVIDYYNTLDNKEIEKKRVELIGDIKNTNVNQQHYKDLTNHWSENTALWIKSYIDNEYSNYFEQIFPGKEFKPNELITKEEIAMTTSFFITFSIELNLSNYENILDIDKNHLSYFPILILLENDFLGLKDESTFGINEFITRKDMAIIMNKLLDDMNYRKDYFKYSNIINRYKVDKVDQVLYRPLYISATMYNEGSSNREIYSYLKSNYIKNKSIIDNQLKNEYVWALKTLTLCGL